jgi:hypothetical protein
MIAFQALVVKEKEVSGSAAGVYLSEGRHPIIPVFQYSNIPIAERSGAKFQLTIFLTPIPYHGVISLSRVFSSG